MSINSTIGPEGPHFEPYPVHFGLVDKIHKPDQPDARDKVKCFGFKPAL